MNPQENAQENAQNGRDEIKMGMAGMSDLRERWLKKVWLGGEKESGWEAKMVPEEVLREVPSKFGYANGEELGAAEKERIAEENRDLWEMLMMEHSPEAIAKQMEEDWEAVRASVLEEVLKVLDEKVGERGMEELRRVGAEREVSGIGREEYERRHAASTLRKMEAEAKLAESLVEDRKKKDDVSSGVGLGIVGSVLLGLVIGLYVGYMLAR